MTKKERFAFVIDWFEKNMPVAETELNYEDPYELLVAVILSAQCTDKRVNMVTPRLFERFPTVEQMSKAEFDDIEPLIRSISFANNKTRHLMGMSKMLMEKYNGEIPSTVEERDHVSNIQPAQHGGGYTCVPGFGKDRADDQCKNAAANRNAAAEIHTNRISAQSTPLADTARPLYMRSPQT